MIHWLLLMFPQYRALQQAFNGASNEVLQLQDRLNTAIEERQKLWEMMQESLNNERSAYQMHINVQWQKQGFGAPYPEAPKIPSNAEPEVGGGSLGVKPELPSTRVARAHTAFVNEYLTTHKVR